MKPHPGPVFLFLLGMLLPASYPSQADEVPKTIKLENQYASYLFSTQQGLRLLELSNSFTGDNNIKQPDQTLLFAITDERGMITAADFAVVALERKTAEAKDKLVFTLDHARFEAVLTVALDKTEESHWSLVVTNKEHSAVKVKLSFPVLGGLVIGDNVTTNRIHHGLNGGMFYDQPIRLRGTGGYCFPVMDVYDISHGRKNGGVYVRVEDRAYAQQKTFEVLKREKGKETLNVDEGYWPEAKADVFDFQQGLGMSATYQQFDIPAKGSVELPPASIGVHPYRWERCWENYRRWVNTWYEVRNSRPKWFREVFVHKALHNSHFRRGDAFVDPELKKKAEGGLIDGVWDWHYLSGGEYVPVEQLVKPYDDMYDWNHWMASRGEYDVRPDWGGPKPFAQYLDKIRQAGVRHALYMEAVCVEKVSSNVGRSCGPKWAVLKEGKRCGTAPPLLEYAFCPGAKGWQRYLAHEVEKVLRETKVESVYLDSVALNYWLCEDTSHDHHFRRGYHKNVVDLLKGVDDVLGRVAPETVVYLEFWSTDVATQYMSGCFSPVVTAGINYETAGIAIAPTGTNLFRFYFPDFKIIEIMPENKQGIELAFFNGNGLHGYFTAAEPIEQVDRLAPIWRAHVDCLTSGDVEALIQTGVEDIYMNRFGTPGKQLYTVWNAAREDKLHVALPVLVPKGWHAVDLLNNKGKELEVEAVPGHTQVRIDLPARSLSVFILATAGP